MSDFLTQLIARNLEGAGNIRPVLPSYFEPQQEIAGLEEIAAEVEPTTRIRTTEAAEAAQKHVPPPMYAAAALSSVRRTVAPQPIDGEATVRTQDRAQTREEIYEPQRQTLVPATLQQPAQFVLGEAVHERLQEREVRLRESTIVRELHTVETHSEAASETRVETIRERERAPSSPAPVVVPSVQKPAPPRLPEPNRVPTRQERREAQNALPKPAPTIEVNIGRVEVKAVFPPAPAVKQQRQAPSQVMPLNEYLENRGRKR